MQKYFLTLALLLLWQIAAFAQNPYKQAITKQGEAMAEATLEGDYHLLAKYTYPKIIEMMGGENQMVELIERGMRQLESQGITFVSVKLGTPQQVFKAGDELHCLVPQTIVLKLNAGNMEQESFLLAVSQDKGKNWFFVDTAQLTNENTGELFSAFNPDLKIPAPKEPVFVEGQ